MALVQKIDSNIVGLRFAEEESPKKLPIAPIWYPLEPNSFSDFGATLTTMARNPINPSRQRKKGVITDLDAKGGYVSDLTQTNFQSLVQGYLFADARRKPESAATAAISASRTYTVGATAQLAQGALVFMSGFTQPQNNGLKLVASVTDGTNFVISSPLTDEAGATAKMSRVGVEAPAGDLKIEVGNQGLPSLTTAGGDFTAFGLIVGEWVYIGGDDPANQFATGANNGFKRIRNITAKRLEFDKSDQVMVSDTGAGKKVRLFFGHVFKNEVGTLVKRRTYQLERTLGSPDPSKPNEVQAEYLVGAVPSEFKLNIQQADKITMDLMFVATDSEQRTASEGLKSGQRLEIQESAAFNTSSDFNRIKLSEYLPGVSVADPLFNYVTDITIDINNNVNPVKAVGVTGAFDTTAGTFAVSGSMTAYFATVEAVKAVRRNADVTFDIVVARENSGFIIDFPLITLGDAQANIEQDQPITLPLTFDAATGAKLDKNMDYTIMFMFFDYLPI